MDSKLTLEQAKKSARQKEAVKDQQKQLQGGQEASLAGITKRGGGARRVNHKDKKVSPQVKGKGKPQCRRCGKDPHPVDSCPAKDAACRKCGKKGHFASQCFSQDSCLYQH
jgi:hypothetical protein